MQFIAVTILGIIGNTLIGAWGSSLVFIFYLIYTLYQSYFIKKQWVNPIFFFKISILFSTLANLKVISIFESGIFLYSYQYTETHQFGIVSLIWLLGNISIIAGFEAVRHASFPKIRWDITSQQGLRMMFYLSVALIFRSFWLPISLPGTFNSLFYLTPLLSILLFARLASLTGRNLFYWWALSLTVLASGYSVLFAYLRSEMVLPIMVFFLGILSSGKGFSQFRSARFYPLYAFLAVFLIFFQTFGTQRSQLSIGFSRLTELNQIQSDASEVAREYQLSAFERLSSICQLSALAQLVSDNGHYQGEASKYLLTALIPRFLWPEKPKIALGVWFALEIGAALESGDWYNTSINMTIPGQLYLDFGWIGLIFGGWLTGFFLRILWNAAQFNRYPLNFTGILLGGYLLYNCFLGFGADLQILVTMLAWYLIILAMDRFLNSVTTRQKIVYAYS